MSVAMTINSGLRRVPVWPFYFLFLLPMPVFFWWALNGELGADPVKVLEHRSGLFALQFLIASLVVTPLLRLTRVNLIRFRRMLGLMAFFYAVAHLTVFLVLDLQLVGSLLVSELTKRPYIVVGMTGFLALVPLALTSNDWSIRKLGAARWGKLHKLAYLALAAGAVHFMWSVKAWPLEPVAYLVGAALLLGWRVRTARKRKRRNLQTA